MKEITVKSILNKKKSRDKWFLDDYTLNPYEGCGFNCQYCFIRGSKYGENMENGLAVKINGAEVLDKQLAFRVRKDQRGIIALSSATDPYIKAEEKYRITESFLKLIHQHRFPLLVITKSTLVTRDIEELQKIDADAIHAHDLRSQMKRGAIVSFSFSTLNEQIASTLEPGAPSPEERLLAMKKCKEAGLLVGANCIPTLPYISDSVEALNEMVVAAKDHGADFIFIGGLTLFGQGPADSKVLYYKFLERQRPTLIKPYKQLYRIFNFPPKEYQASLDKLATEICSKHKIRRSILGDDSLI